MHGSAGCASFVVRRILLWPENEKGAISITNADLARLDDGEFLNDVIINFKLKRLFKGEYRAFAVFGLSITSIFNALFIDLPPGKKERIFKLEKDTQLCNPSHQNTT